MVYGKEVSHARCPMQLSPNFECRPLRQCERDSLGLLFMYHIPTTVSEMMLTFLRLVVLGDINVHVKALYNRATSDFVASMAIMDLSQGLIGPACQERHRLGFVFCCDQEYNVLKLGHIQTIPLSWTDCFLVSFRFSGTPCSLCRSRQLLGPSQI